MYVRIKITVNSFFSLFLSPSLDTSPKEIVPETGECPLLLPAQERPCSGTECDRDQQGAIRSNQEAPGHV